MSAYGPFYGGLLDQRQRNMQKDATQNESLRGTLGLLSQMAQQQQQGELLRQQVNIAKLKQVQETRKQEEQQKFMEMLRSRMGGGAPTGAGVPTGALPTSMDTSPTLAMPQSAAPQRSAQGGFMLGPDELALASMAQVPGASGLIQAAKLGQSQYEHGNMSAADKAKLAFDREKMEREFGQMKPGDIAANKLALAKAAHEGVAIPEQTSVPDQLAGELAATEHRLAQAHQRGDINGVQRENQNRRVLMNEIQKHEAPQLVRKALGMSPKMSPKGQQEVAKLEAEQEIRGKGAYIGAAAKGAYERDSSQFEAAQNAVENVSKLDTIINHLRTSDAITGVGADLLKDVQRLKAFVSDSKAAGKAVSDTELLNAFLGSDVFPMIKALGIGARGLDTPAEREFLREVMSGTIQMNKDTLVRLTAFRRSIAKRAIDRFDDRVRKGEMDRFFSSSGIAKTMFGETIKDERPLSAAEQDELNRLRQRFGRNER